MIDEVQGNVLSGYGKQSCAWFLFAAVTEPVAARSWIGARLRTGEITTHGAWERDPKPDGTLNISFTYNGLIKLGVPALRIDHLVAFREGMAARRKILKDEGESSPDCWTAALREHHALIVLTGRDRASLEAAKSKLEETLRSDGGLEIIEKRDAERLLDDAEHFGFRDGFSQPAIDGVPRSGPRVGEGTLTPLRCWRRLALGEFVLGYRDEGGLFPPAPLGPLGAEATFMVVRKLEQNVARFRSYTAERAKRLGMDLGLLRAKMVGRWPNGSPLARNPKWQGVSPRERRDVNRFHYSSDPNGYRCPVGAHVRRANPRDSIGFQGRMTERHRIIRRGIPYGPPLPAGSEQDDGVERGLMFVCYQSDIERQFEFIQARWLGDGNSLRLGADRDPLVSPGDELGEMVIPNRKGPGFLTEIPAFVTSKGGGYYLLPGVPGLQALAGDSC
jgi:Dyp-type peroxidase family